MGLANIIRQYRKTNEEYEVENQHLKKTIDQLSKRVAELERAQQENDLLRSSIMQFRNDIQKQVNFFQVDLIYRNREILNYICRYHPLQIPIDQSYQDLLLRPERNYQ